MGRKSRSTRRNQRMTGRVVNKKLGAFDGYLQTGSPVAVPNHVSLPDGSIHTTRFRSNLTVTGPGSSREYFIILPRNSFYAYVFTKDGGGNLEFRGTSSKPDLTGNIDQVGRANVQLSYTNMNAAETKSGVMFCGIAGTLPDLSDLTKPTLLAAMDSGGGVVGVPTNSKRYAVTNAPSDGRYWGSPQSLHPFSDSTNKGTEYSVTYAYASSNSGTAHDVGQAFAGTDCVLLYTSMPVTGGATRTDYDFPPTLGEVHVYGHYGFAANNIASGSDALYIAIRIVYLTIGGGEGAVIVPLTSEAITSSSWRIHAGLVDIKLRESLLLYGDILGPIVGFQIVANSVSSDDVTWDMLGTNTFINTTEGVNIRYRLEDYLDTMKDAWAMVIETDDSFEIDMSGEALYVPDSVLAKRLGPGLSRLASHTTSLFNDGFAGAMSEEPQALVRGQYRAQLGAFSLGDIWRGIKSVGSKALHAGAKAAAQVAAPALMGALMGASVCPSCSQRVCTDTFYCLSRRVLPEGKISCSTRPRQETKVKTAPPPEDNLWSFVQIRRLWAERKLLDGEYTLRENRIYRGKPIDTVIVDGDDIRFCRKRKVAANDSEYKVNAVGIVSGDVNGDGFADEISQEAVIISLRANEPRVSGDKVFNLSYHVGDAKHTCKVFFRVGDTPVDPPRGSMRRISRTVLSLSLYARFKAHDTIVVRAPAEFLDQQSDSLCAAFVAILAGCKDNHVVTGTTGFRGGKDSRGYPHPNLSVSHVGMKSSLTAIKKLIAISDSPTGGKVKTVQSYDRFFAAIGVGYAVGSRLRRFSRSSPTKSRKAKARFQSPVKAVAAKRQHRPLA